MKPNLLYLSPVMPAPSGSGLAMRAYHNLSALAASYTVSLLVIPTGLRSKRLPRETRNLCRNVNVLAVRPWRDWKLFVRMIWRKFFPKATANRQRRPFELRSFSIRRLQAAVGLMAGQQFDIIHVFRLYLSPYAFRLQRCSRAPSIQLDLDDIESDVRHELGELLIRGGRRQEGNLFLREAAAYKVLERRWLGRFDRIFVCSTVDKQKLSAAYGSLPVEVVPNVVAKAEPRIREGEMHPFVFLFIGAFAYLPNADGLAWFCQRVLPLLSANPPREFLIRIAGSGVSWRLKLRYLFDRRIQFLGHVPSIEACYSGAAAAIIPLRAGGGTRIKAIEAIYHQLPVVATSKGIEGLDLEPGVDVLIGDTPQEMAARCRELLEKQDLGRYLSEHAFAKLQRSDTHGAIRRVLAGTTNSLPENDNRAAKKDDQTINILGLHVFPLRRHELNARIIEVIEKRDRAIVPNVNVHFATLALQQPWLRDFFNRAPFNFCDGVGIIIGARVLGKRIPERITYGDWIWSLAELAEAKRLRLFFLGGKPGVSEISARNLKRLHPGLQVVGTMHGYFNHEADSPENLTVIDQINRSRPHILLVALGMPLQEKWLNDNWQRLDANIALTGGAVFDYVSGSLRRPPLWMRRLGLEWLGRLLLEPRRLWRRYLIGIPIFLWSLFQQRLKNSTDIL